MRTELRRAIAATVAASAAPYGYTISTWSAGALLIGHHGLPTVTGVFGFVAGAIAAFGMLAHMTKVAPVDGTGFGDADRVLAGVLHWLAAGVSVTAAVLLSAIGGWVAWPLTSFAATTAYLVCAAAQLSAVATRRAPELMKPDAAATGT